MPPKEENKTEVKTNMSTTFATTSKMSCPIFSGHEDKYEDWKKQVKDWLIVERSKIEYPGLEIRLALRDKAFDICKDIDTKVLMEQESAKLIFEALNKVYKKDNRLDRMEKSLKLFKIERKREETVKDYVFRYEKFARQCEGAGGGVMSDTLKGCHLLEQANLTENEKHIVLGACGDKEYNFEEIKKALNRIFQEKKKEEEKDNWLVEDKRNPVSRYYGSRMKCYRCRSEYHLANKCNKKETECYICRKKDHWANNCPQNWKNQKKDNQDKEETHEKKTKENMYHVWNSPLNYEEEEDIFEESTIDIQGLFDSGSTKTIIGDLLFDKIKTQLDEMELHEIEQSSQDCADTYRFGNTSYDAHKEVIIPCQLGKEKIYIRTVVVQGNIPWLIGKETMERMSIRMDYGNKRLFFKNQSFNWSNNNEKHIKITLIKGEDEYKIWMNTDWIKNRKEWNKRGQKLHQQFGHASSQKINGLIDQAYQNKETYKEIKGELHDVIKKIVDECDACRKYKKCPPKPVVGLPLAQSFNEVIACDLGELEGKKFLVMVDWATNFCQASWIKDKKSSRILEGLFNSWITIFGAPRKIMSDNGLEFQNEEIRSMSDKLGIEMMATPAESPWSNGKCERMVGVLKDGVKRLRQDVTSDWNIALKWTVAAKNNLMLKDGISPNQLIFGKNTFSSNFVGETKYTTLQYDNTADMLRDNLNAMERARSIHMEQEADKRLRLALSKPIRDHKIEDAVTGEKVLYRRDKEKEWRGPARVIGRDGKTVIVKHGGSLRRVKRIHVTRINKECEVNDEEDENGDTNEGSAVINRNSHEEQREEMREVEDEDDDDISEGSGDEDEKIEEENLSVEDEEQDNRNHLEQLEEEDNQIAENRKESYRVQKNERYSITNKETEEIEKVEILSRAGKATSEKWSDSYNVRELENGQTKWIDLREYKKITKIDSEDEVWLGDYDDESILKAKMKELSNWERNEVFIPVKNVGQKTITTRWIVTEKENSGERSCKARLVARGFEDEEIMETDAPTCGSESLKVCLTVIQMNRWTCKTLDIKTAYLQGKPITRTVYLRPPKEAKTEKIWKLRKTVYGLKDAARVWYESVVATIKDLGGIINLLDPTVFAWKKNGELMGIICSHVDDFCYGGTKEFEQKIITELREKLEIGKEQEQIFKYIGLNIEQKKDEAILVDQIDYTKRIIYPEKKFFLEERTLSDKEQTNYRSLIGQLNWIAQHTRPDISFHVSKCSKKCRKANTSDMRSLIKIIEKTKMECVRIKLSKLIGKMFIEIFADASFNNLGDGNSQIGYIVAIADEYGNRCPILWKSRIAKRVSKSTLEAESLSLGEAAENGIYVRQLWKEILGESIPIKIRTDCKSLEKALYSKSNVSNKRLRIDIASIKEMMEREEINEIIWVASREQIADILTKEGVKSGEILKYVQ